MRAARRSPQVTMTRRVGSRAMKALSRSTARQIQRICGRGREIPVGSVRFGDFERLSPIEPIMAGVAVRRLIATISKSLLAGTQPIFAGECLRWATAATLGNSGARKSIVVTCLRFSPVTHMQPLLGILPKREYYPRRRLTVL